MGEPDPRNPKVGEVWDMSPTGATILPEWRVVAVDSQAVMLSDGMCRWWWTLSDWRRWAAPWWRRRKHWARCVEVKGE